MSAPQLLMIDELSLGLSPLLVEQLVAALRSLNAEGVSIECRSNIGTSAVVG